MARGHSELKLKSDGATRWLALGALLLMLGLVIAGPSGLMAWSENLSLLDQRKDRLMAIKVEREVLQNRVELLDPNNPDRDMYSELVRDKLNYVHDDEQVLLIK